MISFIYFQNTESIVNLTSRVKSLTMGKSMKSYLS